MTLKGGRAPARVAEGNSELSTILILTKATGTLHIEVGDHQGNLNCIFAVELCEPLVLRAVS